MDPPNKKVKIDPNLKKCCVPFCSTRALSGFSRIPTNVAKKQEWLKILEIPNILTPNSRVCHRHFHESDFINSENRKRLKANAIPLFGRANDSVKIKEEGSLKSALIEPDSIIIKQGNCERPVLELSSEELAIKTLRNDNEIINVPNKDAAIDIFEEIVTEAVIYDNQSDMIISQEETETQLKNMKVKVDPNLKKCSVPFCSTRALSGFSRIPTNEAKKQEWLKILEISNVLKPNARICHRHFNESDFINSENRKRLKTNAIPLFGRTNDSVKIKEKGSLESVLIEPDSVIIKQESSEQTNFQDADSKFERDPLLSDEKSSVDTKVGWNRFQSTFIDADSITIKEEDLEARPEMIESPSILRDNPLFETDVITVKRDPLDTNLIEDNDAAIEQKNNEKIYHKKQKISWEDKVSNVSWVRKYECGHCEKYFDLLTALKRHIILEHQIEKVYDCEICCAIFTNDEALRDHIMSVHEEKKLFACNFCVFKAGKYIDWKEHLLLVHEKNVFKCDICCIRFAQEFDLISHMKRTHEIALKQQTLHSKIVHEVKKPEEFYACNHCFVCFKDKDKLAKHDKVCKDKKFQCTLCSGSYQKECHLESHISI